MFGITASKRDCGTPKIALKSQGGNSHHCFCCHAVQHLALKVSYFGFSAAAAIARNSLGLPVGTSFFAVSPLTMLVVHLQAP